MGWVIWSVIALILMAAFLLAGHFTWRTHVRWKAESEIQPRRDAESRFREYGRELLYTAWALRGVAGALLLIWIVTTLAASIHQVHAGEVGLVRSFGAIVDQRAENSGLTLIWPWQTMETWDVRTQKVRASTSCGNGTPECMDSFSQDNQDLFIIGLINLHVEEQDIQILARNVGSDYLDKVVRPRMLQVVKEVSVEYKGVDIAPNREEIRVRVTEVLRDSLEQFSIQVEDFLIENIDFRPEFKQSIEDKVIAEQNAIAEQNRVAVAEAQAQQVAATAPGASG